MSRTFLNTTYTSGTTDVTDVMSLDVIFKLFSKFFHCLSVGYCREWLSAPAPIRETCKASEPVRILGQCLCKVLYLVFIVVLCIPCRQIDCTGDGHINILLYVSLKTQSSFIVRSQIQSRLNLLRFCPIQIDHLLCCTIHYILVVPPSVLEIPSFVGHCKDGFNSSRCSSQYSNGSCWCNRPDRSRFRY